VSVPAGRPRLRASFIATFWGNALFAASQWAVLSLIAKLGSAEMLGQYALAVAVAMPIGLFSHLNLRAVLATDMDARHPFGDYLAVRLATSAAALAVTAALAAAYLWPVAPAIVIAGIVLAADNLSDICYGVLQRRERMDQVAVSTVARGLVSAAAVGAALYLTRSVVAAMAAQAAGRIAVLLAYDRPKAARGESLATSGWRVQARILGTALPLGVVLMLVSLTGNLPRYTIELRLGVKELGAFAAVASFLTVGTTVVNALGQAATPRLARLFGEGDGAGFRRLVWQLTGLALALGLCGVAAAAVLGRWVLALVYKPGYADYAGVLLWVMAAAAFNYVASMLGYVITSARRFEVQAPLFAVVAVVSGAGSLVMVPRLGLKGAAAALGCAWAVQIAGELAILGRALRGKFGAEAR
jgi:O-antigen/teichoic acid export membrane protein